MTPLFKGGACTQRVSDIVHQPTIILIKKLVIQVQAVDLGFPVTNMAKPKNQLFCRLDGLTPLARKEQRAKALNELGLLSTEAVPTFEETTQKAVTFSSAPIAILGLAVEDELWFKSATGLATIGLTAELAARRKIALNESFSTYVIDSQQPLVIENTFVDLVFANSVLTQYYGIKAYLGVPLMASSGICIGTLSIMDWTQRKFDDRDIDHLTLLASWCLGEFERNRLHQQSQWQGDRLVLPSFDSNVLSIDTPKLTAECASPQAQQKPWGELPIQSEQKIQESLLADTTTDPIKLELLSQLTQELKTPLTSVIGMTSVLHREVYGPLTDKQREYLEIIHNSGQNLITLVDEIVNLGVLNDRCALDLAATDLEMLCQQVVNSLSDTATQHQQELKLSIEPGNRIWSLDKEKVRQALYYLIVSVLEMSEPGGEVKIHVSKRVRALKDTASHKAYPEGNRTLNITVEAFHPWLGADFGEVKSRSGAVTKALGLNRRDRSDEVNPKIGNTFKSERQILTASSLMTVINNEKISNSKNTSKIPRDLVGLLFCCHLTELHEGKVIVRGSESNYRYLLQFPKARPETASIADV